MQKNKETFKNLLVLLKLNEIDLKSDDIFCFQMSDYKPDCALCLDEIDSNEILTTYSSNNYHTTCINFWINLVDEINFPNLKSKTFE